ncbi:helix-turn-helix transcriptional regulator [Acholeplasma manati]|nr:helix-turn-helix transcriptional regulator [Paracholeplasma manati]MDG0889007.1 helix-turn-helix transcriptional regulator [Paracholeplasma manati]
MSKTFPRINMKATGKNIESLRKQKNLSVKEIQEVFGFESPQAIYKWQWGDSLPSIDNLVVLATVFEVSIVNILVID